MAWLLREHVPVELQIPVEQADFEAALRDWLLSHPPIMDTYQDLPGEYVVCALVDNYLPPSVSRKKEQEREVLPIG